MSETDETDAPARRPGLPNVRFFLTFEDGTEQVATTRPVDLATAGVRVDTNIAQTLGDPDVLLHLAFLASGHDRTRPAYADRERFAAVLVALEWDIEAVRPTSAAHGNGSPSSWRLPPAATPADGSRPTPAPL